MQCQRLIENDPDLLFTSFRRAPARPLIRAEDRFDGKTGIFRADFDRGNVSKIKPSMVASRLSIGWTQTHYPLPHIPILPRARAVAGGTKGFRRCLQGPVTPRSCARSCCGDLPLLGPSASRIKIDRRD